MPQRDIEFRLVQAPEKPPINKNTKIRSDRNSQAGGTHDPKKLVSEPAPSPAPKAKPAQPKQPIQQKVKQMVQPKPQTPQPQQKVQQKPSLKPVIPTPPKKPTPIQAPSAKPALTPTPKPTGAVKPSAPKLASAPKSPFQVSAPQTKSPVGSTYKPQGATGGSSAGSTSGTGAPAPKFSSGSGAKAGVGSTSAGGVSKPGARGTGGYGSSAGNPSPGNPNGTPGVDAIKQVEWGPYMRDLEARIKKNWQPPRGDSSKRVVITFTISRDGRLLSHRITKSSGVPLADRAALGAIELTAPFKPLPPEFRGQSIPIEFTFDYNVLNSSVLK